MTYSVWDPVSGQYDYYVTPQSAQLEHDVPMPRHLNSGATKLGVTPEQAAWPLPAGAKKVGRGQQAKGMIARRSSMAGLGDDAKKGSPVWGILAGIGVLVYFVYGGRK